MAHAKIRVFVRLKGPRQLLETMLLHLPVIIGNIRKESETLFECEICLLWLVYSCGNLTVVRVYSVGSQGNYMFEDGLVHLLQKNQTNCEIHVFDPGQFDRPNLNAAQNIHYHPWGISSSYQNLTHPSWNAFLNDLPFVSLPDTMKKLGHVGRRIDIFKIDCEGCEWRMYKDLINVDIRQILVETHLRRIEDQPGTFFKDLQSAGFVVFHKEANTHPSLSQPGTMFEFGLVKLAPGLFD